MLKVENLTVKYGVIPAIMNLSLEVETGQIVTILGANGAGKTTTLKAIMGVLRPASGQIFYQGEEITHMSPSHRVRKGIALVPEGRGIFNRLTVEENLLLGAYSRSGSDLVMKDLREVYALFPRLEERKKQIAGTLSGGEQQMLALGRGLMSKPRLLLLDEPSLGLAPLVVRELYATVSRIREQGVTILLVEQSAAVALGTSDYAYVLESGNLKLSGKPEELKSLEDVKRIYLGG
ncbi:MAG: ABC transporter ATP-binding protein [Atribacterota bacterium]